MLEFFTWCENTALGEAIRASLWLFPVIESVHLLALAAIGGAVLMMNLKLLGWGVRRQTPAELWRDTRPWLLTSLATMLVTGFLLFFSEATKLYYHDAFWVKMASLALAIVFTFTVTRKVALMERANPVWAKAAAVLAIALWTTVGICGRWIGFS